MVEDSVLDHTVSLAVESLDEQADLGQEEAELQWDSSWQMEQWSEEVPTLVKGIPAETCDRETPFWRRSLLLVRLLALLQQELLTLLELIGLGQKEPATAA